MNKTHRTIWNEALGAWVAVSEIVKSHIKSKRAKRLLATLLLGTALGSALAAPPNPPAPTALPTGGVVSAGAATIGTASAVMTINQTSQRAAINWNTFDVGSAAKVNIEQPNAQAVLMNRVLDSNPSQIFGKITATGHVYLVNPSGVYFSPTASVDVGGLVATTHSMSDADFMAGSTTFKRNGATGSIENEGELRAKLDGYIALLAPNVVNQGVIVAERGTAILASGESITLDFNAANKLTGIVVTASDVASLIENRQAIETPDGQIIMSAQSVSALRGSLIKNSGTLIANEGASSITHKGGRILLEGDEITLTSTSKIEAKGSQGGGTVLVGGDWQGSNGVYQATKTTMQAGATIDASATVNGDGGKVVLWSEIHNPVSVTSAYGSIKAEGGVLGGNGGQIETSGYLLNVDNANVSAAAPLGRAGNWLLDPYDYTLNNFSFGSTNVTIDTSNNTSCAFSGCSTSGSAGNINISGSVTGTGGDLTLIAAGSISGNGAINMTGGTLTFNQSGTSTYYGGVSGSVDVVKEGSGSIWFNSGGFGTFTYSGLTTVRTGTLRLSLQVTGGQFSTSGIVVESGATFDLANNLTGYMRSSFDRALTLNGTGVGGGGALISSLNQDLTGLVTLGSDSSIGGGSVLAIAGGISGTSTLTKVGSGVLRLASDSPNFSGKLQLDAGSLEIFQIGGLGTGTRPLSFGGGVLDLTLTGAYDHSSYFSTDPNQQYKIDTYSYSTTWATPLTSVGGSLTKLGSGSLTLPASNTYSGNTNVSAGTLIVTGSLSDNSAVSVASGATYRVDVADTVGSLAGAGSVILNADLTTGGDSSSTTFSGDISGANSLTKIGTGTQTLSGSSSYTGATILSDGVLSVASLANGSSNSGIGASSSAAANLVFDGGTLEYSGATVGTDRNFTINTGKTASIGVSNAANTLTINGAAATTDGGVTKVGSGTLKLAGANNYSGATTVSGGVLQVGNATALGSGLVTVQSGAALDVNGITMTPGSGGLILNGTGISSSGALYNSSATTATYTGAISLTGDTAFKVNSGPLILNGEISGPYALTKLGSGTLTLAGVNIYTGTTTVSAGTLAVTNNDGLSTTAAGTTVASGATLDLQGVTVAEAITLNGGTLATSSGSSTASGAISLGATSTMSVAGTQLTVSGDVSGGFGLTKSGSGTLLLSGNNTFTGTTTVSAGVLQLGSASALGTTAGGTTISNGGAIDLNGQDYSSAEALTMTGTGVSSGGALFNSSASAATFGGLISLSTNSTSTSIIATVGDINISNTGTITGVTSRALELGGAGNGTMSSILSITGSASDAVPMLTKSGAGTWTLNASNTLSGGGAATLISGGVLKLGNASALGGSGGNSIRISSGGAIDLNGQNLTFASPSFTYVSGTGFNGSGVIFNSSGTTATYGGKLTLESNVQIGGSTGTINFSSLSATSLGAFELTLGGDGSATFAGYLSGTGSLKKTGAGTWNLTGTTDSTYTGVTTVSAGTLVFSRGAALGMTGSGTTVEAGATLQVESNFGTNYSAEPITLHGGTLTVVSQSSTKLTGAIALTADSFITAASGKSLELSGIVSGAFALTKTGAGTGILSGANTYSGVTSINDGKLELGSVGALGGTSLVNITQTGTLDVKGKAVSAPFSVNGFGFGGNGAITNTSTGTATLSGDVALAGDSSIGGSLGLNFTGLVTGNNYQLSFVGTSYNDISLTNAGNTISKIAAGSADFSTAGVQNLTLNTTSDLTFGSIKGFQGVSARGSIVLNTTGSMTLAAGDQLKLYSGAGNIGIGLKTARFINNAGASALFATANMNQNWTVWSTNADPYGATPDVVGGLIFDFKEYNKSGSGLYSNPYTTTPLQKRGLVYTYAPVIAGTISGTVNKVYDGTTTVSGSGLTLTGITGTVGSDVYGGSVGSIAGLTFVDKNVGTGKTINGSITGLNGAFTDSGKPVYGYGFSGSLSATGDITAKALTLNSLFVAQKTYDTTTAATFVGASTPTLSASEAAGTGTTADGKPYTGDTVSLSYASIASITGTYVDANAGAGKVVTVTGGLTLTGADAGNYSFKTLSGNISPKRLTVNNLSVAASKVYDGTTAAMLTTLGAFSLTSGATTATDGLYYAGDAVSIPTSGVVTGAYVTSNVGGAVPVAIAGLTLSGAAAANYILGLPSAITPATLTYTAMAASSTYGSTPSVNAGSVTGFVAGQTQATATTGTLLFSTAATSASNVGSYLISGSGLTANNGNYTFVQAAGNSAALTINPAPLNLTVTKIYNADNLFTTGFVLSGTTYNSDTMPTVASGSASVASANVNSYSSFASNALLLSNGNYTLTGGTVSAAITPKALTVSGQSAANKTYDGGNTAILSGGTLVGVVGSEDVTLTQSGTFDSVNAGTAIGVTAADSLGGTGAGNYSLTQPTGLTADITAKSLTISGLAANNKTYDATTNTSISNWGSVVTGVGTETLTLNHGTASFADANAGTGKTVTASGYSLANGTGLAGNYVLSSTSSTATADIAQRALTISAVTDSKTYDGTTTSIGTPTIGTLYGSDSLSGLTQSFASKNVAGANGSTLNVGVGYTLSDGNGGNNYSVTLVPATGTISKANLTITAATDSKTYDGNTNSTGTPTVTSGAVFSGDNLSGLSQSFGSKNVLGADLSTLSVDAGYTLNDGNSGGNYNVTLATASGTINKAVLTVTGANNTVTYNAATQTNSGATYSGNAVGESFTISGYGSALHVGTYADSLSVAAGSGTSLSNYNVTYVNGGLTINKALLGISVASTYNGTTTIAPASATLTGLVGTDSAASITQLTINSKDVASASYVTGFLLSNFNNGNYELNTSANTTLGQNTTNTVVLSAKALSMSGLSVPVSRAYDGTTVATVSGTPTLAGTGPSGLGTTSNGLPYFGDVVSITGTATGTYNSSHVADASTVSFSGLSLSGGDAGNYMLTMQSPASATITPALLTSTVTNTGVTKLYDGLTTSAITPTYSFTGLAAGDTAAALSHTTQAYNSKDVLTANQVTVSGLAISGITGSNNSVAGDYALDATSKTVAATITPAALTLTANSTSKTYGDTLTFLGTEFGHSGLQNGETVGSVSLASTGAASTANVAGSPYAITAGSATGGTFNANNYSISYVDGALTVTRRALTVGNLVVSNKTYDGLATAAIDVSGATYTGLVSGDDVSVSITGANFASANAGTHNVILSSNATGASVNNYSVVAPGSLTGTISQAPVTVTADAKSMSYGGNTLPTLTYTHSGLVGSDAFSGALSTAATAYNGTPGSASNAGTYAILQNTLSAGGNYALTYVGANLTVNKVQLTVTGNSPSMTYGGNSLPTLSAAISGYVNGDSAAAGLSGSPTLTTTATAYNGTAGSGSNAGSYPVSASVAGMSSTNYTFAPAVVEGVLTVNPATLTYTANAATTTYGATPTLSGAVSGFVNGDLQATATTGSLSFTTAGGDVGNREITGSGLAANNGNYTFVQAAGNTAALTVTPASLTVTANDQAKTYDGLGHTAGVSYTGFVYGQNASVLGGSMNLAGASTNDGSVYNGAVTPGSYDVTPAGLTSSNYAISYATGLLTIDPAPLTVTARNATKVQDNRPYSGGNGVNYTGFVNGENASVLSGALTYTGSSQNATRVGSFNIMPGGLSSTNYDLSFVAGRLTITAKLATDNLASNLLTSVTPTPSPAVTAQKQVVAATLPPVIVVPTTTAAATGLGGFKVVAAPQPNVLDVVFVPNPATPQNIVEVIQVPLSSGQATIPDNITDPLYLAAGVVTAPAVSNTAATGTASGSTVASATGSTGAQDSATPVNPSVSSGAPVQLSLGAGQGALPANVVNDLVAAAGASTASAGTQGSDEATDVTGTQTAGTAGTSGSTTTVAGASGSGAGTTGGGGSATTVAGAAGSAGTQTAGSGTAGGSASTSTVASSSGATQSSDAAGNQSTTTTASSGSTTTTTKKTVVTAEQSQLTTVLANDAPLPTQLVFNPTDKTFTIAKGADIKLPLQVKIQLRQGGSVVSEKLVMLTNEF